MNRRAVLKGIVSALALAPARDALAQSSKSRLILVVGPQSPLKDISLGDLRRLFSGEPVADTDGRKLIALNHPVRTPDRVTFDRLVLEMTPEQVSKFWVDRKIRGQSGPPRIVSSLAILLGVVSRLPGAVGYVRPQYLTSEVRPLTVSGVAPSSASYPLIFSE